jgi:uncharacterized membrane protein YidH (DUF202 family)
MRCKIACIFWGAGWLSFVFFIAQLIHHSKHGSHLTKSTSVIVIVILVKPYITVPLQLAA